MKRINAWSAERSADILSATGSRHPRHTLRLLAAALTILTAVTVSAADVTIVLPGEGQREVWTLPSRPQETPAAPGREFTAASFSVETGEGIIVVRDKETGNVAMRAADAAGTWTIGEAEWLIGEIVVAVWHRGNPVASSTVELSTGDYSETRLTVGGAARFFGVPPGEVMVTARYVSENQQRQTPPQTFLISLDRDEVRAEIGITIPDPVEVVAEETPPEEPESGFLANLIIWLIALGAGAFVLWFAFRMLQKNETAVAQRLRSFGVQIPEAGDQAATPDGPAFEAQEPLVPPGHCQYCGKPEAECVCNVDAPPVVGSWAAPDAPVLSTVSPFPKLVNAEGLALEIPDGSAVLGREGADLIVADPTVSRRHAEVIREGGRVRLRDLGSSNGTFVNGAKLDSDTLLQPGDTVQFGAARFRYEG